MERTIILNGEPLRLKSSLFTIIEYRNVFGTELFSDIKKMDITSDEDAGKVIDVLFKIVYILNRPYTKQSYDDFLTNLDFNILSNPDEIENLSVTIAEMLGGGIKKDSPK
jgi:hypothetical protein